jgi:hypothetical protein
VGLSFATKASRLPPRTLPGGSAEMVAVEGPGEIPGENGGPTETQRPKPALPGAGQKPETIGAGGSGDAHDHLVARARPGASGLPVFATTLARSSAGR